MRAQADRNMPALVARRTMGQVVLGIPGLVAVPPAGPGGPMYDGLGGAAFSGPGGAAYDGPGGACYAGPGGPCNQFSLAGNCPNVCH